MGEHHVPAPSTTLKLFVAVEGTCSKLALAELVGRVVIVHGHRDDARAAETFTEILGGDAQPPLDLLRDLPTDANGYVPEELRLEGRWPGDVWLRRAPVAGQLHGESVVFLRYERNRWIEDRDAAGLDAAGENACAAALSKDAAVGSRYCWRELDRHSLSPTETFAVGQCNICSRKAPLWPPHLLAGRRIAGSWSFLPLPDASRLRSIEGASLAVRSSTDAYVAVAGDSDGAPAYFARFDGRSWSALEAPFPGEASSINGWEHERLWATAGGGLWSKAPGTEWSSIPLTGLVLTDAPVEPLRAYRVQVRAPGDVWVEVAPSVDSPHRALLHTVRPKRVFRCNEALPSKLAFVPLH